MPNEESSNCVSQADDTSQATTVEACDLQPRQRSDATHDVSESHKEERTSSSKNEKDSDMLLQKPSSNPGVPAQEPNPPPASLLIRDDKALKKVHGSISSRVPPHFSKIRKDKADNMHLRQSPNSGVQTSETCDGERNSTTREMVLDILLPAQNLRGALASQSDKQKLLYSTRPEKTVEKLQPRRNPDNGGCSSQSYQVTVPSSISETLPSMPKEECNTQKRETVSNDLVHVSSLSDGVPVPQPNQEKFTYSTKPEKVEKLQPRRNPDPVVQGLQSDGESTPSKIVEKGQHDGYNWRKYGQKLVKGNKFVRSYYKCTFPNCQAKKQVERSHDGCKTDINYLGKHHHQKPQHNSPAFQIRTPEIPVISATKTDAEPIVDYGGTNLHMVPKETSHQSTVPRSVDDVIGAVSCSIDDNNTSKDDYPDSKRQKREIISADDNAVNRSHSDLRHVVQTLSEVDIVNDGYRWRKYGQKLVKGNPNPRSYYRCSNAGCPVKKHVERASHDSKVVITTYEGQHDHDMPLSKPVGQSTTADDANMIATNGESRSKPEESNPVSLEMVVHAS